MTTTQWLYYTTLIANCSGLYNGYAIKKDDQWIINGQLVDNYWFTVLLSRRLVRSEIKQLPFVDFLDGRK